MFTTSLGNVPPGAEVTIVIKYVSEMQTQDDKFKFVIPASVAPKSTSAFGIIQSSIISMTTTICNGYI